MTYHTFQKFYITIHSNMAFRHYEMDNNIIIDGDDYIKNIIDTEFWIGTSSSTPKFIVDDEGNVKDKNGNRIACIKLNRVGINQNGVVNNSQALVFECVITKDGNDISFQILQPP